MLLTFSFFCFLVFFDIHMNPFVMISGCVLELHFTLLLNFKAFLLDKKINLIFSIKIKSCLVLIKFTLIVSKNGCLKILIIFVYIISSWVDVELVRS